MNNLKDVEFKEVETPDGEIITSMIQHEGRIFVSTQKHVYVMGSVTDINTMEPTYNLTAIEMVFPN